jgi:hypothetical protein
MKSFKSFRKELSENFFGDSPTFLNIRKNLPKRIPPKRPKTVKAKVEKAVLLRNRAEKNNPFDPK